MNYTILHLHSDLSNGTTNIDSVTKYYEYVDRAKEVGMNAMAFSEHGSVFEWIHKKQYIEKAGMKYIHASEFYLTESVDYNNEESKYQFKRDNYHCLLIAKNYAGVKELNVLSSQSWSREDRYYYAPRITFDELFNTSDNIIITTACVGGVFGKGELETKKKFLKFLIDNKHRCYLEIQHHNTARQIEYNKQLKTISDKFNIPLIACTDTHCLNDIHVKGRDILQKSKGVFFNDEEGWDLTFKTYDELVSCYKIQNALPEDIYLQAIENTNKVADLVEEFELDYSHKYPQLYTNAEKVLKEKILNGIKWRGIDKKENYKEYQKRIAYEFETYRHNKAINFLLLEEDYKSELRRRNINFGYSRGSCSGSIICYLLGITEVDSVLYNLNFERFMNKERVSLADIDTDYFSEDRPTVREILFENEKLNCCDIITFNTIALKGAIKDVGKALGYSLDITKDLSDSVEKDEDGNEYVPDKIREKYKDLFEYVDIVKGTIVSIGNHPAACIVTTNNIEEELGTCTTKTNKYPISQVNMKEVDSLNYVKLDILGLDAVGLIKKSCELIGIPYLLPENIDFNDINVWKDIAKDTTLIFQFEGRYASEYLKTILQDSIISKIKEKNKNFSYLDLMSIANGAIRPAGQSYRDELSQGIYRDNGHEALNEFLAPTLGFLVYQEQIIEFLNKFCGFTMGEADTVRRGFAKKTGTEQAIPKIKQGFNEFMAKNYSVLEDKADVLIENFLKVIIDVQIPAHLTMHSAMN